MGLRLGLSGFGLVLAMMQGTVAAGQHTTGVGAAVSAERPAAGMSAKENAARFEGWRKEIRKQLFVPDKLPALEAKVWSTFSPTAGVLADRVTYRTADGMLVPAIVYRPDPAIVKWKGKLPGIVIVNGHGSDKFGWYAFWSGMLFAKAGAVVVTYDLMGEGERNSEKKSKAGSHDAWVAPAGTPEGEEWGRRLAGLMQVDVMQAVSYLEAQPEVDTKRIAVAGYSLGSFVSGITGALDKRIHAMVLSGAGVYDGPGGYFDFSKLPCQGAPYRALTGLGDRGAILFALNADRGPLYVMNGDADEVMDIQHHPQAWFDEVRARAVALRGTDKDMFTTVFYPGISHRTSWVNRDGVTWLSRQLGLKFMGEKEIAAYPVTHVSTWAKANGVEIAPAYMQENREGGLDALGSFPAIKREDLMVLPAGDWERMKLEMVYEGWVAKVKREMDTSHPSR